MENAHFAQTMNISGKKVGCGEPVFIIAEAGVNHNGELELAKRMVDAAASAGADAIKFQNYHTDGVMVDDGEVYKYEYQGKLVEESIYAMLKRLELPDEDYAELFAYARTKNIIPFATVTDLGGIENMMRLGATVYKVASSGLNDGSLLKALSQTEKPLILSTGMATADEISDAVANLQGAGIIDAVFLHCVSLYPTPIYAANLRRMLAIKKITGCMVGYSDHTLGNDACVAAVAMGARILEKHFTLDKSMRGPDHSISADPGQLQSLVKRVREMEKLMGTGEISPQRAEIISREKFKLSFTAAENLSRGTILSESHLCLKRPGSGIPPIELANILGKKLKYDVRQNQQIAWTMLE